MVRFSVNLMQARVIWEEETLTEKMFPSDYLMDKPWAGRLSRMVQKIKISKQWRSI